MQWKLWFIVYNCLNWIPPTANAPVLCSGPTKEVSVEPSIVFNSQKRCEQVGRDATKGTPFGLMGYRCKPLLDENE